MDWKLYEENKKHKEEREMYRTMCWVLAVIIIVIAFLWYRSDNWKVKKINDLQDQIAEYEEQIEDLKSEVEFWKGEAGE